MQTVKYPNRLMPSENCVVVLVDFSRTALDLDSQHPVVITSPETLTAITGWWLDDAKAWWEEHAKTGGVYRLEPAL
jgi:hypothetical protein